MIDTSLADQRLADEQQRNLLYRILGQAEDSHCKSGFMSLSMNDIVSSKR